jgi:hypothetical protein
MTRKNKTMILALVSFVLLLAIFFYKFSFVSMEKFEAAEDHKESFYVFSAVKQDQLVGLVVGSERSVFLEDYKNKNVEIVIDILNKKGKIEKTIKQTFNIYNLPVKGFKKLMLDESISDLKGKGIKISHKLLFVPDANETVKIFHHGSNNSPSNFETTPKLIYKTNLIQLFCESRLSLNRDPKFEKMYYFLVISIITSMVIVVFISSLKKDEKKR